MSNKRYAIWYEPTSTAYEKLKALILDLATKYDSPIFEPHITLLPGGSDLDKRIVVQKLKAIAEAITPFATKLTSLDFQDEYFKCLFVKVEQTSELVSFARRIQQEFNGEPSPNFMPHMSILYGQLSVPEKQRMVTELGKTFDTTFVLEKVDVIEYELNQPPKTWKKVASLKVGK